MDANRHPTNQTSNDARQAMLSRTVRFCINPDGSTAGTNGYAARPAMRGLGRYYEMTFTLVGTPDPRTGYIVGIQEIDAAARNAVIPQIGHRCRHTPTAEPASVLADLWPSIAPAMPRPLARVRWTLTPTYSVEMSMTDTTPPSRVLIRQKFDFAAAHRLHVAGLSDEQNRAIFGKCNNPNGHGHNYQIEPAISIPIAQTDSFDLSRLEDLVDAAVIEPFDHKHLNDDTDEFNEAAGGVIPSVERIAMVCHQHLVESLASALPDARLEHVTVWETDRTSCTYPA